MKTKLRDPWDAAFFGYHRRGERVTGSVRTENCSPKTIDSWLPAALSSVTYDPDPSINYIAWVNNAIFHGDSTWKEIALQHRSPESLEPHGRLHSYYSWKELHELPVAWFYLREEDSLVLYRRDNMVGSVAFTSFVTAVTGFGLIAPF